jgi:hypothetical protein
VFPRVRPWLIVASLFTLGNAAGFGWALAHGEMNHAAVHVALTLLGVYFIWLADAEVGRKEQPALPPADERLERLQQSMDAVALEVERIGEAQRYSAKKESEHREPPR